MAAAAGIGDIDLVIRAFEQDSEPLLALAAILAFERDAERRVRQIVLHPVPARRSEARSR